jgi:aldehyde:ferredoxin oxidoreductase
MIYFEISGPLTLAPKHYKSKPSWTILDQNLMAAVSAGGNCLFTTFSFVPSIAYKLPGMKITSTIVSKLLTYTWFTITALLKAPPALLGIHLPLLPHSKFIKMATGMKMNLGLFFRVGDRGYNMEKLFNLREGIGKDKDTLPKRFTDEPLVPGDEKSKVPLDKMLPKYYKIRGWDENGVPTPKTLKRLGLDFADIFQFTLR